MKAYFNLCGKDAAEFPDSVLMSIYSAIKRSESFIGVELSEEYSLQIRPSIKQKGWYVELLNTVQLNMCWTRMSKKDAQLLLRAAMNSPNPVQFMEGKTKDWQSEILSIDAYSGSIDQSVRQGDQLDRWS